MISVSAPVREIRPPFISLRTSEQDLVSGLRQRCEFKFRILYKMYAPALMGIIYRIVKSDTIAEDVLQESFLKIWNSIQGYDDSRGRLFTWMAATARHTAIDQLRSRASINADKNSNIDDFMNEPGARWQTEINPDTIGIRKLTCMLRDSDRETLELIYFQGYSHSEAAERLGIPIGTVKTRLRRAISVLRGYF